MRIRARDSVDRQRDSIDAQVKYAVSQGYDQVRLELRSFRTPAEQEECLDYMKEIFPHMTVTGSFAPLWITITVSWK